MNMRRNLYLAKAFLLLMNGILGFSCQKYTEPPLFIDLPGTKTGVFFENRLSYSEAFNMVDYLYYYDGGGVAVGDINNDGLSDIYLVSNEGENALYLNQGKMKFRDISNSAGVKSPGLWKTGVSMVDINGDGWLDIYLCRLGNYKGVSGKNELYINQGDLTFKEEAASYNLDFSGFATQAAFFDMDNDGDLDLYLLNHSVHAAESFGGPGLRYETDTLAGDRLYRNDGNFFIDISGNSGIYRSRLGYGLGVGLSDIDGDGFTDIFVANDFMENDFLYLNNQNATFTEVYQTAADYTSLSSMGCDLVDFNNDGLVDIMTLDMLPENETIRKSTVGEDPMEIFNMKLQMGYMPQYKRNMLQLNRGDGSFSEIAMMAGIHATDWSWAPLFADFDNDGWKDLFISNGIKGRPNDLQYLNFIHSRQVTDNPNLPDSVLFNSMPDGNISNYFFRNNKDLTFENVSEIWGAVPDMITQGVAYSDLDNDGDLDLVLNNLDKPALIKENTIRNDSSGNYLGLQLSGPGRNTRAVGARIQVYYAGQHQLLELYPVRGYKSSVDYRLHIGLGSAVTIDSLIINWPGGRSTTLRNVEVNRILELSPSDSPTSVAVESSVDPLFTPVYNKTLGLDYIHRENSYNEFNREPLIPHMHSREGPALAIADVNHDGLDDFFIGGAKHQEGAIYIQNSSGFFKTDQPALLTDRLYEDVKAEFCDFDHDGDDDLVVVSGGNEFEGNSPNRQPRLYLNDGTGLFTLLQEAFSGVYQTGSCIAIHDFDQDGWQDIFFGSQVEPWNYGVAPKSYLLKNITGKAFKDASYLLPNNGQLGMINDAEWVDLAKSGHKSLVLVGEWMNITILTLTGEGFELNVIPESSGWWKAVQALDFDGDGDQDLLVGNLGLNAKMKAGKDAPVNLYVEDFDRNGRLDPIMTVNVKGEESIFNQEVMLTRQIPSIGLSLPDKISFAEATPRDFFGGNLLKANKLTVNEFRSGIYINENGEFYFKPFPNILQISPIRDFLLADIMANGSMEILSVGNMYPASMHEGRYAAGRGSVIKVGSTQVPEVLTYMETGFSARGDVRGVELLKFQGNDLLAVTTNNDSILWFRRRKP